ncbi:MAG: hypothetical protein ABSA44_09775 [Bacteroidota bacterium]|jgi:hypothetical protein
MIELQKTPCNHIHDFTPIVEGNETVGMICILDGCGFSVREDMHRSHITISANTDLQLSDVLPNFFSSHNGQKGGRL